MRKTRKDFKEMAKKNSELEEAYDETTLVLDTNVVNLVST